MYAADRLTSSEITALEMPWTEKDITDAISSWKSNRSPGPDGFSGEFYNTFLTNLLPDLKEVFSRLNLSPHDSLYPLNDSYIVLVPKKELALTAHDYRPISLINGIQKIYSKILATKIKPLLHQLLSPNQTGFLKNRSILHGFHYAQHLIYSAAKQGVQIAALKVDLFKAFDTIQWSFLSQSLLARGFPTSLVCSVSNRVLKGTSRTILNSVAGKPITLKRGVRQGDPLSPYLFNLAVDFLPRWIQLLNERNFLTPPFPQCKACLLYADDTLLFLKPTVDQLLKAGLIFTVFGKLSGLNINPNKSELALTSAAYSLTQNLAAVLQCKPAQFPIKYLGLPLSYKRLTRADFSPVIDRIQSALATWKAPLLSIGGRIILTNAVISTIPQYYMSVFLLPKWLQHRIDQIRKRFLWHGHKDQQGHNKGLYMVNWNLATRPRSLGGLGVRDIRITNHALLSKWMWQWNRRDNAWWKQITIMENESDRPWADTTGSPFWKDIMHIAPVFDSSVSYQIGNGNSIQFWHDNWKGTALKHMFPNFYQAVRDKNCSIRKCKIDGTWHFNTLLLSHTAQMEKDSLFLLLQDVNVGHEPDGITWLRSSTDFSVRSVYKFLAQTPSPTSQVSKLWQIKAPLKISVFAWLLLNNRLATIDNLVRKGWHLPSICAMCEMDEETTPHLFQTCPIATDIRSYIFTTFATPNSIAPKYITPMSTDLLTDSNAQMKDRQLEMVTCFVLWRERCARIFSEKSQNQMSLLRQIRMEFTAWFPTPKAATLPTQ